MSEEEIQNYHKARNYAIESLVYVWEKSKPKLEMLMSDNEKLLPKESYDYIKNSYDTLSDGIIQSIIEEKFRELKSIDAIQNRELNFFKNIAAALPDIFNDLYYAYLENSKYTQKDEHISKLAKGFANHNLDLRYPKLASTLTSVGPYQKDWHLDKMDDLLHCYDGVVSLIQSVRNSAAHLKDTKTKKLQKSVGREIKELVMGANSPGNIFVLIGIVTVVIHEFSEILQTYVDTINYVESQKVKK